MTNILITNDDGPNSYGLKILQEATRRHFRSPVMITIVPDRDRTGSGTSLSPMKLEELNFEQTEPDTYSTLGTPLDIIDAAFLTPERFLARGHFDLVLCGVNRGANTGVDIHRSGTTMAAITANTVYGACAWAFSQEVPDDRLRNPPEDETKLFPHTYDLLIAYFQMTSMDGSECWNVNFPMGTPRGWRNCPAAHYSRYRQPPLDLVPRARNEETDLTLLMQGWVTISQLDLSLNPPGRF